MRLGGQIMTGYPINDDPFLSNNHLFLFRAVFLAKELEMTAPANRLEAAK